MEWIMPSLAHAGRNIAIMIATFAASLSFADMAEAGDGRPPRTGSYQHPRNNHYQDHRGDHYQDHRNDPSVGRPSRPRDPGYQNPYMPGSTATPPRGPTVSGSGRSSPSRR